MDREEWRSIKWATGLYDVSNRGRVRSNSRTYIRSNGNPFSVKGALLKQYERNGYRYVKLNLVEYAKEYLVDRLVADAFIGPCPPDKHVLLHDDGIISSNYYRNLRWVTSDEFQAAAIRQKIAKTIAKDIETNPVSDEDVIAIRTGRASGVKVKALAEEFRISQSMVFAICTGKYYAHLPGPIASPFQRKLSPENKREITKRSNLGEDVRDLAREFNVSIQTVRNLYRLPIDESY
jgi:NUMOD4 motif